MPLAGERHLLLTGAVGLCIFSISSVSKGPISPLLQSFELRYSAFAKHCPGCKFFFMTDQNEQQIAVFSELIAESRSRVFGYIYAMLHNMSDAEDVYQQTTVVLWEKFDEFKPETSFCSWALKIAYYNIKNFRRSQGRTRLFFSDSVMEKVADSYQAIENKQSSEKTDALVTCLKRLSEKQQQLLKQRYAESTSIEQLAKLESKSAAAISMVLVRLRKSLLRCIEAQQQTT